MRRGEDLGRELNAMRTAQRTAHRAPSQRPPSKPAKAQEDEHPLKLAYDRLTKLVPHMPKDADGFAIPAYVRAALAVEGIDGSALSVNGFAELLAAIDVSPEGFPSFGDFVLALSRPHRDAHGNERLPTARPSTAPQGTWRLSTAASTTTSKVGALGQHEQLASTYSRGPRLHAGALKPGLPRTGMSSTDMEITPEVLSRVAGGETAMPGPLSRPDGYRLDASGSYRGVLPGLESHRAWTAAGSDRYWEELEQGVWVTRGGPTEAGDEGAEETRGLGSSAHGFVNGRGHKDGTRGAKSDRRAQHVARGDAVVLSPRKAGPASSWRKYSPR